MGWKKIRGFFGSFSIVNSDLIESNISADFSTMLNLMITILDSWFTLLGILINLQITSKVGYTMGYEDDWWILLTK